MRPKKIILCVNDNEQELSVHSFLLATHGYRVIAAHNAQQAVELFKAVRVDLVLVDYALPGLNGSELVTRLKQIARHVPMVLVGDPEALAGQIHMADALLAKKHTRPEELLQRIKIMSVRKRGPRKGTVRAHMAAEMAGVA